MNTGWRGQRYFGQSERQEMSQAFWCDVDDAETNAFGQTGHAFSGKDPDRRHYAETQEVTVNTGNSYGRPTFQERQEVTETLDMCGYHHNKRNMFKATPKAIEKAEVEAAKADADMWRSRYEADHVND
jgi:hypothetical protein